MLGAWEPWQIWTGCLVAILVGAATVPIWLNRVLDAYDKLILRFLGSDILEFMKSEENFKDGGYSSGTRLIWYQPVAVDRISEKVNRSRFIVRRALHQLRRDGKVKKHGEDGNQWMATGGA